MTSPRSVQQAYAARILPLIDLTSLNEDDDATRIAALVRAADTPYGTPAALCIYPRWVSLARRFLAEQNIAQARLATVANFPSGSTGIAATVALILHALAAGADEIDVVLPWRALQSGDRKTASELIVASRMACNNEGEPHLLKVILESGELEDLQLIRVAAGIAIQAGADFIKTSTGKMPRNATLDAAQVMLEVIRDHAEQTGRTVGLKVSGGIRTVAQANMYLTLADTIMGPQWATRDTFRFGASSLLNDVLAILGGSVESGSATGF